jgi:hypothetical protein
LKYHEHCVIIPGWGYLPGRTDSQEAMVTKLVRNEQAQGTRVSPSSIDILPLWNASPHPIGSCSDVEQKKILGPCQAFLTHSPSPSVSGTAGWVLALVHHNRAHQMLSTQDLLRLPFRSNSESHWITW